MHWFFLLMDAPRSTPIPIEVGVDRVRIVGGRTMHWNAVTLRYAARDFKERSMQGIEEDWPITYEEIAPYYERMEQIIGVLRAESRWLLKSCSAGKSYLLVLFPGAAASTFLSGPPMPWAST